MDEALQGTMGGESELQIITRKMNSLDARVQKLEDIVLKSINNTFNIDKKDEILVDE